MKRVVSFLLTLGLVATVGCGPKKSEAPPPKSDIVERLFAGRAVGHGFHPAGVARIVSTGRADSSAQADSATVLAVWIEMRKDEEGALMGVWFGDTTLVQIAGGTGLRGFARPGEAGAELRSLARAEAGLFVPAAEDLAPPGDGKARLWVVTPEGVRRAEVPIAEFLGPDRRSTPFLQEARLFARTTLGDVIEFEAQTAATLESLDVKPVHTAEMLARAVGIDPDAEH
jgi:hypothetical protein